MNTIAWLLIIAAILLVRGVAKGRVVELPGDMRDMLLGALTGDMEAVKEAAGRTGEGLTAPTVAEGSAEVSGVAGGDPSLAGAVSTAGSAAKGVAMVAEMRRLGTGKPYVWGGTFANGRGGDCSGLVWRALKNLGLYTGPRFTTFTWPAAMRSRTTVVTTPAVGDICVWQRGGVKGHMGIVVGPNRLWSALGKNYGVRETSISGITGRLTYYRLK